MIHKIRLLFTKYPHFFLFSSANLISGIGSAMTVIVVYAELGNRRASPLLYSLAFALGILPGLFSSAFANRLSRSFSPARILISVELLSAACLTLPLFGIYRNNLVFLILIEAVTSLAAGLLVPLQDQLLKRCVGDEDLPTACAVSNTVFSGTVIFGQVLGSASYFIFGSLTFLGVDLLSYLLAAGFLILASRMDPENFGSRTSPTAAPTAGAKPTFVASPAIWKSLTVRKKRIFFMGPALAAVCAPCMAVLPSLGDRFQTRFEIGALAFSPVLILILFKTVGQMLGPLALNQIQRFKVLRTKPVAENRLITGCLMGFLICYAVAFRSASLLGIILLVVTAHVLSNVVFMLGYSAYSQEFTEEEIRGTSTQRYQLTLILMGISSVIAGAIATSFGPTAVIGASLFSLSGIIVVGART